MNELMLLDVAERRPENLLLVATDEILALARDNGVSPDLRRTMFAELVVRWCLTRNGKLEGELASLLVPTWRPFADWYRTLRPWTGLRSLPEDPRVWPETAELPGFVAVLRRRLARLFAADGFIPVCCGKEAWFVPFQLASDVVGAVWSDGGEIPVWREPVCKALAGTDSTGIRLLLRNGPELGSGVRGNSLMLPVRMAAVRGKADGLPAYDVLQVRATGAFDDGFRLEDVELRPKFDALKAQSLDALLIGPDVPGAISRDERGFFGLDAGLDEQGVMSAIRDRLERMPGCVAMSRDYVLYRLPDMVKRVDRENHRRWNEVAVQLEQLKGGLSQRRKPEEWLEFMSLLATAYCHAGRTEDSRKCTLEAMSFAKANGYAAKALRLQVTAAVNAQDMGEIEEYKTLAADIADYIESFSGPERDDLLMRFHGTAAQANAFGAIYGIGGFSREDAMDHVEKAVKSACAIADSVAAGKCDESERDKAESDVAQDLNYRHLMFALFQPCSAEEKRAFAEAERQLNELARDSAQNGRYHLIRQKSLAYFNAWRAGMPVPDAAARVAVRLPAGDAEDWLVAANRRHLGALAAAAGDGAESESCFKEGEGAMPLAKCWAPVLGSIRFALLVQAACSLAACGKKDESARYAVLAEETCSTFCQSRLFGVIHAEKWLEAIHGLSDPRMLPAFYY